MSTEYSASRKEIITGIAGFGFLIGGILVAHEQGEANRTTTSDDLVAKYVTNQTVTVEQNVIDLPPQQDTIAIENVEDESAWESVMALLSRGQ